MECAVDVGNGLACKNLHEASVTDLNGLIERNLRVQQLGAKAKFLMPSFYLLLGLLFALQGIDSASVFSQMMGYAFLLYGVLMLLINLKTTGK
jgi:hypothetical protein